MDTNPPMLLRLNGNPIAEIISYSYETPWANGKIEFMSKEDLKRFVRACEFLELIEDMPDGLTKEEDDQAYFAELEQREISNTDVDTVLYGKWQIMTRDNEEHEIYMPKFDKEGFITWRW